MSLSHSVRRSLACRSLRSFVSPALASASRVATSRVQPFSSASTRLAHDHDQPLPELELGLEPETENVPQADAAAPSPPTDNASLPWYLQVEPPPTTQQKQHPFSERQRLPPLPSSPPPLLQPILEHVSVELGLDHLSLLDLRTLDPPPALGANLLMIIGTARSEKHLHVSADRLCRWLRSNHDLTPYADGLLGRNELKLKMRRKAKRTRLLSAVGAKQTDAGEIDDGIRTGWVCVNVGRVEGGLLKEDDTKNENIEGFVGFGSQTNACRIVVQMMTDEKRGEADLETLWNGILRRANKARGIEEEVNVAQTEQPLPDTKPIESSSAPGETHTYRPQPLESPIRQQARAFHSSARSSYEQGAQSPTYLQSNTLADSTLENSTVQAAVTLHHMLDHLKSMEPRAALEALGQGSTDQESTAFLKAFYSAMPTFPETDHWHSHVALRCHAIRLLHSGYSTACIIDDLRSIRMACIIPAKKTYMAVLETLLAPPLLSSPSSERYAVSMTSMRQSLDVLDCMHEDGYDPVSDSVLRLLYRATPLLATTNPSTVSVTDHTSESGNPLTLNQLLPKLSLYALHTSAMSSVWSDLWKTWRSYPRRFLPRSSEMYVLLFDIIAQRKNQRDAETALRSCVPEMYREQPVVKLEGEVASAIQRCLEVAEPRVEKMAKDGGRGEWAILWRRCSRALGAG